MPAQPIPLPLSNGFYKSDSLPVSAQECVNMYPSIPDVPALSELQVFGCPGVTQVATSGDLEVNRGAKRLNGKPYFVNGNTLYRLNADYTLSNLGTIEGTGRVSMAVNDTQLMILVPGGEGYIFTENPDVLQAITDGDFRANGNPLYVVFIDSYFLCTTDEKKFITSALNDGLSYNALDFGSAESSPDATVAPFVFANQLFIGGETTVEGFTNIGGSGFPFQRSGLFLEEGILAPFSIVHGQSTVLWVGAGEDEGPAVWALSGNSTQKLSTQAIDSILERLTTAELQSIFGWAYSQAGHYFAGFALPDTCLVYDFTTGLWHERKSQVTLVDGTVVTQRWRANSAVKAYGKLFVGDSLDGRIGIADLDTYTEYGGVIRRVLATQPFQNNMKPMFVSQLELTVESGVGNAAANDPVVEMSRSKDGGKTFSDPRARSIGRQGEYSRRAIWRRVGRTQRFDVYRFAISDPVKASFIQLTAKLKGGT